MQFVRLRQQLATRLGDEGWLPTFASLLEQGLASRRRLPSADPLRLRAGKWPSGRTGRRTGRLAVQTLRVPAGQRAPVQDIDALLSALARQWEGARWRGSGSPSDCGR